MKRKKIILFYVGKTVLFFLFTNLFLIIYIIEMLIKANSDELLNIKDSMDKSTAYFNHMLDDTIDNIQNIKEYVFVLLLVYSNHIKIRRPKIDILVAAKGISSLIFNLLSFTL
jgi:hypothetical protein